MSSLKVSDFTVLNLTLTNADQWYRLDLPPNTQVFEVKAQNTGHVLKLSHTDGGPAYTVAAGTTYRLAADRTGTRPLWVSSPTAGAVVEVANWR